MFQTPEILLHHLGPYLATDRFRALLANQPLPTPTTGAAMFVDISGFTPLTVRLVEQFGPKRASEELKRRLNPMFEIIAGQVFTHGGSVLRFTGDGFNAWFPDELPYQESITTPLPGLIRAAVAGVEMLEMMAFFQGLDIKVAVSSGAAQRWTVGDPRFGLLDALVGSAVDAVADLSTRYQKHEARAGQHDLPLLQAYPHIHHEATEDGDLLLTRVSSLLVEQSRAHRWPAWKAEGEVEQVLAEIERFVDPYVLEQEKTGLGSLSGELRYATPLFLNFMGIDYNHDPDAYNKLDTYVRAVQTTLHEMRGRMVSLEVGDKGSVIFAIFGAPIAYGDDTQRALHAALVFRDLPQRHPYITGQSIGVSRGLLYSGTVGGEVRHEYTSLGDETNMASRLMSADTAGRILVSRTVYEDTGDFFDFDEGAVIHPKGRSEAVQTYIPLRARYILRPNLRKSPLVGREKELERFHKSIEAVGRGTARVLRLEGEAGIGKSRLAAELIHLCEMEGWRVAVGNCLSTGRSIAFLPWRPLIRALIGLDDEHNDAQELIRLSHWINTENEAWAIRLPLLGDLLGLSIPDTSITRNLAGAARQQALFALVLDMLYHEAGKRPLNIVIEDTHWIDEVSEALTIELVTRLQIDPAPILVTLMHRPAEESEHPPALLKTLADLYIHYHLPLNELSEEAVGQLIAYRLGGSVPHDLIRFVYGKSQGNPFFVQEIVDTLQQEEIITRLGTQVYIDQNLNTTDIPQTVQGLILARIDNLSETEKIVLKLAAVIGRQFEMRVLYQSLPIDMGAEAVMQHLRTLEQRKFSQLESLYPEPTYAFRHAITQEVAYQTLLYDQRRRWHRSVGTVLENLHPNHWERLAYHFSQSDDEERAFVYLVRAGDKTAREFANQAALDYWAQAFVLARTPKERFDLLCKRLELLIRTADQTAAETDLNMLVMLAQAAPDNTNWQIRALRYQAEHALDIGQWEQARQFAETGAKLSENYNEPHLTWEILSILVRVYTMLEETALREGATRRLRNLASELTDPALAIRLSLNDLLEKASLDPDAVADELARAYERIRELSDPILEANYWNIMSRIAGQNLRFVEVESHLRTQLSLWRQIGNRRMEGHTLNNLGITLYELGQYSEAGGHFRNAYKILNQVGDKWGEANSLTYLGAIAFRRQAIGEASAYVQRALVQQRTLGASYYAARSLYLLAMIALAQEDIRAAEEALTEALTLHAKAPHMNGSSQVMIALAYVRLQKTETTLPPLPEFEPALRDLADGLLHHFQDIDIAFWQARLLCKVFGVNFAPLQAAFHRYVDLQVESLTSEEARQNFLHLGYMQALLTGK